MLHARSCIHFLWFPHTPKSPLPHASKTTYQLKFAFYHFQMLLYSSLFRAHVVYGYTSRARGHSIIAKNSLSTLVF